jgi:hypothetical protein
MSGSHTDRAHALFSPSASSRWLACPGSVRFQSDSAGGQAARNGTAMHEHAEKYLLNWEDPSKDTERLISEEHKVDLSPDEWHPHVVGYVTYIRDLLEQYADAGYEPELHVEQRVHIVGDECWGSCDAYIICEEAKALDVTDLKTGHRLVSPDSTQFKTYALGVLTKVAGKKLTAKIIAEQFGDWTINLHRYQAADERDPGVAYTVDAAELIEHFKAVATAVKAGLDIRTPLGPAGDHCRYCPGKTACTAMHGELASVEESIATVSSETSGEALQALLDKAPTIEALIEAARAEVYTRLERGLDTAPSGYKLVAGRRGSRRWNDDVSAEILARVASMAEGSEVMPVDLLSEPVLLSPAKAEKLFKRGTFDEFVIQSEGKPTLVSADDKRPALTTSDSLAALD